jgi:hypothetical protein
MMVRELTGKDMDSLYRKVESLLKKEGVIAPHHGDTMGVEFILINRQQEEPMQFFPVSYVKDGMSLKEFMGIIDDHRTNLSIAHSRLDTVLKIFNLRMVK